MLFIKVLGSCVGSLSRHHFWRDFTHIHFTMWYLGLNPMISVFVSFNAILLQNRKDFLFQTLVMKQKLVDDLFLDSLIFHYLQIVIALTGDRLEDLYIMPVFLKGRDGLFSVLIVEYRDWLFLMNGNTLKRYVRNVKLLP